MDILYWINNNSQILFKDTTKIFFKKYLYKMNIYCPGSRSVYDPHVADSIALRRERQRSSNYGGSWATRAEGFRLHEADIDQITEIKNLLDLKDVKIRIEDPYVQIYAHDEQTLKTIADGMSSFAKTRIRSVHAPADTEQARLLLDNKILRKSRRNAYQYKVVCRDGRISPAVKLNLLNYLDSLGDTVSVPDHSREMLKNKYSGFWGVYYYTNDLSINTFVELIHPGVVVNVHEIVVVK